MSETFVEHSIDYSAKSYAHTQPIYTRTIANSGATTVASGSVSSPYSVIEFTIQNRPVNLANSYLTFDITIPAGGATGFNFLTGNVASIFQNVVLTSQTSGCVLADIKNVGNFLHSITLPATSVEELDSKYSGITAMDATSLASARITPIEDIQRGNATTLVAPILYSSGATGDAVSVGEILGDAVRSVYSQSGAVNTASYVSVKIPLSAFKFSALAIDKLLPFGEALTLSLYIDAPQRWLFTGITQAATITTPAVAQSVPTFSSFYLYACYEKNAAVNQSLMDKVRGEGMSLDIPVVWTSKYNVGATTAHTVTQTISKAFGNRILFLAFSPYANTESSSTCKAHTTYNFTNYQTTLNSEPLICNAGIDVTSGEQYLFNKKNFKGSVMQTFASHANNFVHIDNFTGLPLCKIDGCVTNGLDVQETQQYQIVATTASVALNWYVYAVCQKTLHLASGGMSLA